MNGILLDLGFIKIYWYSVMIFIAILIGGTLALRESRKWKISEEFMINLFFFIIPIALIGARLYYVAFEWDYYKLHISEIFKIWEGGLAIHGGILAGLLWILFYSKKYKVNTKRLLDIIVVSLLLGQAIGRWGNFFNGEVYGMEVSSLNWLPKFISDKMLINGVYHQPLFLYESIWCLFGFIIALIIRKIPKIKLGELTSFYLIWYGIGRFFLESLREPEYILMIGNFKVARLVSFIMVAIGIIMFLVIQKRSDYYYNERENENVTTF